MSRATQPTAVSVQKTRKTPQSLRLREDRQSSITTSRSSTIANKSQGLEKTIPDTPKGDTPVHLRDFQIYADRPHVLGRNESDVGVPKK